MGSNADFNPHPCIREALIGASPCHVRRLLAEFAPRVALVYFVVKSTVSVQDLSARFPPKMVLHFSHPARIAKAWRRSVILASLLLGPPLLGAKGPTSPPLIDRHTISDTEVAEGFKKGIAAFFAAGAKSPPAPGGIPFVGSSTIRLWQPTMAE